MDRTTQTSGLYENDSDYQDLLEWREAFGWYADFEGEVERATDEFLAKFECEETIEPAYVF